jgi:hypothetical protein
MTVSGILPTWATEYEDQATYLGKKSPYGIYDLQAKNIHNAHVLIDFVPYFRVSYFEIVNRDSYGRPINHLDLVNDTSPTSLWKETAPSSMWTGLTFVELLKIIREWSFMVDEPFNSQHPMALISKQFFESLETPEEILDSIDALPDSYLVKFLKGDSNFRDKNPNYPTIPNNIKQWLQEKMNQYPQKEFYQYVDEI